MARRVDSPRVDWEFARTVAEKVAGKELFAESYHSASMEEEMVALTVQAEQLVAEETGLRSLSGAARARVTDRAGWINANLAGFERLTRPLIERLSANEPSKEEGDDSDRSAISALWDQVNTRVATVAEPAMAKASGAQMGAVLGWMASRVLGQYDLLIIEDDRPEEQDWVYYVAPNVLALEKKYGFPPAEFRLWLAVHECTHRAQFTGVPWLREYFLSLVNELLDATDPDPKNVLESINELIQRRKGGDNSPGSGAGATGGIAALVVSPEQRITLDKITGLMSLLEGHGDIVMDRATEGLVPSRKRFARVMSQRRQNARGISKLMQKLTGIDAKLAQYEEGENFIHAVETAGGRELFDRVWTGPEALPTIAEIREPEQWITRMAITA